MSAHDLMTPNPVFVTPDATVAEAWDLMRDRGIRHLPVVADGTLVGMLSDRDLAHFDMGPLLAMESAEELRRALSTSVATLMSSDVVSIDPEADLGGILDLLVEHRVGALPVVRPETGQLVGIVSYIDVLEAVRESVASD